MLDTDTAAAPTNPTFEANMAAFAEHAPGVHAKLQAIEAVHSQIVVLPDGGIDMSLQGQAFYGRDAVAHTQGQFDAFVAAPLRWKFNRPNPDNLSGVCGNYVVSIEDAVVKQGIGVRETLSSETAAFAIVFGIGLGLHIEPLIEHTGARHVVLIEPMIENLYHSLFVVDWAALLETAARTGMQFVFVLEAETATIVSVLQDELRSRNPALLDGVYIYQHYASAVLSNAFVRIQRDFFLNISGLGFFEDEVIMMANGCINMQPRVVKIVNRPLATTDVPLFIVGSGRSIDGQMGCLKEHRDKVMVMSIGSGLQGLLENDIRPDFHVELENGRTNAAVAMLVKEEFGLEGVSLIAPLTVHANTANAFDEVFFSFRERVSSTLLFKQEMRELSPAGPTVANTALAAAIRFGFRRLYLFGVDMGSRNAYEYHSTASFYARGLLTDVDPETEIDGSGPANFGGMAVFHGIHSWSRLALEGVLRVFKSVDCVNCSDGARIEGARPQLPETLEFDHEPIDHKAIKDGIRNGLAVFTDGQRDAIWRGADLAGKAKTTFAALRAVLDKASPDDERMSWSDDVFELVRPDDDAPNQVIRTFLCGTMVVMLGCTTWYAARLENPEDGRAYRVLALDLIRQAVDDMAEKSAELFDNVEELFAGQRDGIPVVDVTLAEHPALRDKMGLAVGEPSS